MQSVKRVHPKDGLIEKLERLSKEADALLMEQREQCDYEAANFYMGQIASYQEAITLIKNAF